MSAPADLGSEIIDSVADCPICSDNAAHDAGTDVWAVARLKSGYVRLNPNQYFPGSCFFVAKECVREVHHLDQPTRQLHLAELAEVLAAVEVAFAPTKLNCESLGNTVPHLHWWITPRATSDARPHAPIWEDLDFLRAQWTEGARPTDAQLAERRSLLLSALKNRDLTIELPAV